MEIDISNNSGIIDETEEKAAEEEKEFEPAGEPLTSFEYNVKNEEEEEAFTVFQRKYVYKRNWVITGLFAVVAAMFAVSVIRDPSVYINWVLCFVCLVMIFTIWFNTFRIKKYLMRALKSLENDNYRFTLYNDCFKIETVFTEEEMAEEDFAPVKPRIIKFEDISLNIVENSRLFIIILKKETIYVLSKRVIGEKDCDLLRAKLTEALGEDYEIHN